MWGRSSAASNVTIQTLKIIANTLDVRTGELVKGL